MNVITRPRPKAKISAAEAERRQEILRKAIANSRMEGLYPTDRLKNQMQSFVNGEVELCAIIAEIKSKYQPNP